MKTLLIASLLLVSAAALSDWDTAATDMTNEGIDSLDLSTLDLQSSEEDDSLVSKQSDDDDDEPMPLTPGGGACYRDCGSVLKTEWTAMQTQFKACQAAVHSVSRTCHEETLKAFSTCKHSREFKNCVSILNKAKAKCTASRKKALKHKCHALKKKSRAAIQANHKVCKNKCCHAACAAWGVKCNARKCRSMCCAQSLTKCKAECKKATSATEATASLEDLEDMDGTEGESEVEVSSSKCFNVCQGTLSSTFRSLAASHQKCRGTPTGVHKKCLDDASKESSACHGQATSTHRSCAKESRQAYAQCIRKPVKDHRLCHCKAKTRKGREACAATKAEAVNECKATRSSKNRSCENAVSKARKTCNAASHKAQKACYGTRDKAFEQCMNTLKQGQTDARKKSVQCKAKCCHGHCKNVHDSKYTKGPKCMRPCFDETKASCDKKCKATYKVGNVVEMETADDDSSSEDDQ